MWRFDGLYALASLDGAPLAPRDLAALDLPTPSNGFAVAACDRGLSVECRDAAAFLGHLDRPAALATDMGLDPATSAVDLAMAAAARHGDDASSRLLGEWSFLHWDARARALTLMASDTLRDPLLFATDGRRVAVAPHPAALRRLDWVDEVPGGPGLLLAMGRARLRGLLGDRTMLRDVRSVGAGTRVRIATGGVTAGARPPLPAPAPWQGSFADAVAALDDLLRLIVRDQLVRHPASAAMLSGGLDSSLIATIAAAARIPGTTLFAVTSAAPADSGLLDEVEFAHAVAAQAGMPLQAVAPPPAADAFLPAEETLRWLDQPLVSPRHYVYDALYRAAADGGATAIFDGSEGEWTVTGYLDEQGWRRQLRNLARRVRRWTAVLPVDPVQDAFHVRLNAAGVAYAKATLAAELSAVAPVRPDRDDDLWGYAPAIVWNLADTTTTPRPGLRRLQPFRDRRLLTLFAGMPRHFLAYGGLTRAPGRALLAGRVPEHVRLRTHGRPFSPDYDERIRRHAAAARERLPGQVRAGAGEWLDLAWLDGTLARIGAGAATPLDTVLEAQTTACAAAFLARWASLS